MKADAKCNQAIVQYAIANADIEGAIRRYDEGKALEQAAAEKVRLEEARERRLADAAPALLAALEALLEFVPQKCRFGIGGELVPDPAEPQNVAIDIANAVIAQAKGDVAE
jgi:hypothetical protein